MCHWPGSNQTRMGNPQGYAVERLLRSGTPDVGGSGVQRHRRVPCAFAEEVALTCGGEADTLPCVFQKRAQNGLCRHSTSCDYAWSCCMTACTPRRYLATWSVYVGATVTNMRRVSHTLAAPDPLLALGARLCSGPPRSSITSLSAARARGPWRRDYPLLRRTVLTPVSGNCSPVLTLVSGNC